MPVDLNGKGRRFFTRERGDLEIRRTKGEASCAECKRLKLKCDRKTPCTSCVRRGCELVCPNGSLAAGQGTRFVLADTDKLHKKLLQMSRRIRQLEDALEIAQAGLSANKHPLLSDELLAIKSGVDFIVGTETPENNGNDPVDDLSSELGTLSMSESGEASFMGRVSSEIINESMADQIGQQKVSNDYPQNNDIPQQIMSVSEAFPFAPVSLQRDDILRAIEARLPSYARATALAEAYLGNVAWFYCIVEREQIFEELLPSVYKSRKQRKSCSGEEINGDDNGGSSDYVHHLALLLSVLANGAAGDLTLPIANDEANLYEHLARAALSLNSVFIGTSMENVQAVVMLAAYGYSSGRKYTVEPSMKLGTFGLTLACSLKENLYVASQIGLHRDPARWKMEPKLIQRRRRLFWELFTADKWKSLETGRPATFNLCEVDCEFPEDREATLGEDGSIIPGFWRWKYRFTKEVAAPIAEQVCLARPVKYVELLELDRKLRDFEAHRSMSMSTAPNPDEDIATILRRCNWSVLREAALLFVHRNLFARAMRENSSKILDSPFASSALSAYTSAMSLLKIIRVYFERYPQLLLRQWIIWVHGLTSAVVIGSVACAKGLSIYVTAAALKELETAVDLFKQAHAHPVPRKGLPFLLCLLEKSRMANGPMLFPRDTRNAEHELSILGGAPLFLKNANKKHQASGEPTSPTTTIHHASSESSGGAQFAHSLPYASPSLSEPSASRQSNEAALPQTSLHNPSWPFFEDYRVTADVQNAAFHTVESSQLRGAPTNIDETLIHAFANTPSQNGPTYFSNIDAHAALHSSFATNSRAHVPFQGNGNTPQAAPELTATSWFEELSNNTAGHHGQDVLSNSNNIDIALFMGGSTMAGPNGAPGNDPVIADAWRSFMADSRYFGSQFNTDF